MSDWTDLGLPSPQSGNYGFDRDVGILRTPFDSPWPRQKQGFKAKRETFNVWCMIGANQLAAAETFFAGDAYDWFTMPLRAGGAAGMADYTVRALGPCSFVPLGTSWWKAQFKIETQIAADAPDLTDPGYSTAEETCCLADDIQCCDPEIITPTSTLLYLIVPLEDVVDRSAEEYDESAFTAGASPFANAPHPFSAEGGFPAIVGTEWQTNTKIWLRYHFELVEPLQDRVFTVFIDNMATVWCNGTLVLPRTGEPGDFPTVDDFMHTFTVPAASQNVGDNVLVMLGEDLGTYSYAGFREGS